MLDGQLQVLEEMSSELQSLLLPLEMAALQRRHELLHNQWRHDTRLLHAQIPQILLP